MPPGRPYVVGRIRGFWVPSVAIKQHFHRDITGRTDAESSRNFLFSLDAAQGIYRLLSRMRNDFLADTHRSRRCKRPTSLAGPFTLLTLKPSKTRCSLMHLMMSAASGPKEAIRGLKGTVRPYNVDGK